MSLALKESAAGGLVGRSNGSVVSCYATGTVSGGPDAEVGGLVGYSKKVIACFATGAVSGGSGAFVGGLVGENRGPLSISYATGAVSGSSHIGGLVGSNHPFEGKITNSYFDKTLRASLKGVGIGHLSDSDPDPLAQTTSDLQGTTDYVEIFETWNLDIDNGLAIGIDNGTLVGDSDLDGPWIFTPASSYPRLRVDFDRDGRIADSEFEAQQ